MVNSKLQSLMLQIRKSVKFSILNIVISYLTTISFFVFLLPWFTGKNFMLYVLDHVDKILIMIDPLRVLEWCEDNPYRKYGNTITHFYKKYIAAMNVNSPNWNQNIYKWSFTHENGIVEDDEKG